MTTRHLLIAVSLLLAACESGPSEVAGPGALYDPLATAAPEPTTSCYVYPVGTVYDVAVTWSRVPVTVIVLYDPRLGGSSHRITLDRRQRKGNLVVRLAFQPFTAGFGDRDSYRETACVFVSS